jgi:hypothetical protein
MRNTKRLGIVGGVLCLCLCLGGWALLCRDRGGVRQVPQRAAAADPSAAAKPKVLLVDSYHEGYPWSEGIIRGACEALRPPGSARVGGPADSRELIVDLRIARMDTKRNTSEEFKRQAGQKVKEAIDAWRPGVVICCDDNSVAYVIVPFYRNADLPFVFCGVNWDASAYGLPCRNVTGMVEVSLITSLLGSLRQNARGDRVGLLGARNESNQKEALYYRKQFSVSLASTVFVDNLEQWKSAYVELQDKVDMLILAPPSFLAGEQDQAEARRFVLEKTRIPTGSVEDWIAPYSLVCNAKIAAEQGQWAARAALRILAGTAPREIPVAANRNAQLYLNMPLARKLGVIFPVELIEQAVLIGENGR